MHRFALLRLRRLPALWASWVFGMSCASVMAQWASQTVSLHAGWNAVFLEVQPEPRECVRVFAGLPVESVWRWNRRFNPVEFIQDPSTLVAPQPDWLAHFASTNHPLASQGNLFAIEGGRPYLIKMKDDAGSIDWVVTGRPVLRQLEWLSDSLNFVGFGVPSQSTSTFKSFFSGSPAHLDGLEYCLDSKGSWSEVSLTNVMRSGEAFWIRSKGRSKYQGPAGLMLSRRDGLDFGRVLVEQTLRITNQASSPQSLRIRVVNSLSPPADQFLQKAGEVPLKFWKFDPIGNDAGWKPISTALGITNLTPGKVWEVRLEVRRAEMTSFSPPSDGASATYQSLLEVTDTENQFRWLIPVSAEGWTTRTTGSSRVGTIQPLQGGTNVSRRAGLWVGSVEIDQVSQPASTSPSVPTPVGSPSQFRILADVDAAGRVCLLQKALQMWKSGTYKPDPNDPKVRVVDEPGRYVLVTDDARIPDFTGAALRDGESVARRFSTTAFGFRDPILMGGEKEFGEAGSVFSCSVVLGCDDPLNPFLHWLHPDNNNLDERFERKLPEGNESFTVIRDVQTQFTAEDPFKLSLAGWGDTQLGGKYTETIRGLHKQSLVMEGSVRLQLASRVRNLNDQP